MRNRLHNGLIQAYMGFHVVDYETAMEYIRKDDNITRLSVYCQWEGLIGYSEILYDIATTGGEF